VRSYADTPVGVLRGKMKKLILVTVFILISMNLFSKELKINNQLMFTDNWYTASTVDEVGSFEINISYGWNLDSSVFNNENNAKVAESYLYKIKIGQRYNGVIVEKLQYVDYDPPKIMEKQEGKTKNGYLYDLEITATIAKADEGYIVWYPCSFFVYNLDYCLKLTFYARNQDYQKELEYYKSIIDTLKFPCKTNGIINDDSVRIREEPNLKSSTLGKLNKNDTVEIIGSTVSTMKIENMDNKWYKILLSNNTIGWIYGAYVDLEK